MASNVVLVRDGDRLLLRENDRLVVNAGPELTYQWWIAADDTGTDAELIPGATATTYLIQQADTGKYIRIEETATKNGLSASAFSLWAGPVTDAGPTFKAHWALNKSRILGSGIK